LRLTVYDLSGHAAFWVPVMAGGEDIRSAEGARCKQPPDPFPGRKRHFSLRGLFTAAGEAGLMTCLF
jgi:hypothetical protein